MIHNRLNIEKSLAIFLLIPIILLIVGVLIIYKQKSKNETFFSQDNNLSIINSSEWNRFPYFSDIISFIVYYPSEWFIIYNSSGDLYESKPLARFSDQQDSSQARNSIEITYYDAAGEDLITWVNKKKEILKDQFGYAPEQNDYRKDGKQFFQLCFLGDPGHSPMPYCFVYFQYNLKIFEFKIEGTKNFPVEQYSESFVSKFSLLGTNENLDWLSYNEPAAYSIDYPADKFPPTEEIRGRVSFTKDYIGSFMVINIIDNYSTGQYWFDKIKNYEEGSVLVPQEVIIDDHKCIISDYKGISYDGIVNPTELYCQMDGKILEIVLSSDGNDEIDVDLFQMTASIKFNN